MNNFESVQSLEQNELTEKIRETELSIVDNLNELVCLKNDLIKLLDKEK